MNIAHVIIGEVVTEKAIRQKEKRTYTIQVHPGATKVDVKNAVRQYYNVDPVDVRILTVPSKQRQIARGRSVRKRAATKRALVTLSASSKPLDLATLPSS